MNLIAYAVQAVQRGFRVFPVEPLGKTPHTLIPGQSFTLRWGEAATHSLDRVIEYWSRWPDANIGIACKPSGLLVVDCDMPKQEYALAGTEYAGLHDRFGSLVDGTDVYRHICESLSGDWRECHDTYRVCTGSLGCHYYYRWPTGVGATQASPVPGLLDVRGSAGTWGGYVLGAGSVTHKGAYVAECELPIRDAPGWLVELLRARPRPRLSHPAAEGPFRQPRAGGALGGLVRAVESAQPGNRNQVLLWAARAAAGDGIALDEALGPLTAAYVAVRGDGGERQARATIRSAYRLQGRNG
ncbi:bifunctional DNA primase/polymerase [Actinacidiphila acididurans]|uniref:Bifunctional DNA primase/polymerase n=1 Tax=Actinacidiphila acididurans TaxID=2784346 RepID=A0ABS2TN83_9ACTN|nr:bifunctional DNA primase/polymerase [Actinacidiphila acididurans]MBM9504537.1 bifunctional DNA primase/polymerase [Actinacidiphila acididurans]